MGLSLLASGLLNLGTSAMQAAVAGKQNETNLQMTRETNEANLQQVRETNAANAQQAELAYQRSLPINQVASMMDAGMSRPAALAALAGGGSYTAPVMQAGSLEKPQVDYSQLIGALERIENIPANAMQFSLQNLQFDKLKDELQMQKEQHEANLRALNERLERERDEETRKKYGQNVVEMTDKLANRILEIADSRDMPFEDFTDESDMVKRLDLNKESLWRNAPDAARQRVRDILRSRAEERRAEDANMRARIAADDAHRKAILDEALAKSDLNERQKSLVYKLEILANQVAQGRLSVEQLQDEKTLRQAGFENKKEAAAAFAAAENLRSIYEKDKARRLANAPATLAVIDLMFDKVNPLRELISISK